MPGGFTQSRAGVPSSARTITSCQVLPAIVVLEMFTIGELSLFPTHTPTAMSGV